MVWQQKIFKKHIKGTILTSIFTVIFILSIFIANSLFGWNFKWQEINPIELPPIWIRALLSAITFITVGNWLFQAYFYKILYEATKFIGFSYKDYIDIKKWIWYFLMIITALVFIPGIVNILNTIASILFNTLQFIISTWLFLGFSIAFTSIIYLSYIYFKKMDPKVFNYFNKLI